MPTQLGSELWNEGIKLISFCPVCETRYNSTEARLLGEQAETHFLHVQCRKCKHAVLALVVVNQVGASSVGLLTDLSYDDLVRMKTGQKVSVDDVIEVHQWFKSVNSEFELGRGFQEQVHHVRERIKQREKKGEKKNATL